MMSRRGDRMTMGSNPPGAPKRQANQAQPRQLLVWRTCLVCDWEGEVVETEDADTTCPQCHGRTEVVAMAPVPAEGVPGSKDPAGDTDGRLDERKRPRARASAL